MSQVDECRPKRKRGRPRGTGTGARHLQQEMAKRLGISVRQAYRITAELEEIADRRHEQHALLTRYVLLEVCHPGQTNELTDFLDDLLQTVIEETGAIECPCLDRRWARAAGKHIARCVHRAVQLRDQRLIDTFEKL